MIKKSENEELNFGIIGCGRIVSRHVDSIREIKDARLIAVCDVIGSRVENIAKETNSQIYLDYKELLENIDIDVVNICTPSGMHAEMAMDAMRAGKHVIVEKPMALNVDDANEMIAVAAETNTKLCVVLQNRYNPPMQDLYNVIQEGKLGRLLLGNVTVRWYRPQEYYEDGWHGTAEMDGGALMNQVIHHIDALNWLMGDVESVYALTGTLAHEMEMEDTGVAVIKFASGALASIEGSTITYPQNIEGSIAIFGKKGSVKVGGTALNKKTLWKIEGELEHEIELIRRDEVDPPTVYGFSHKLVIEDMISAILEDRQPKTNGKEGKKSVELVNSLYKSAKTGKSVEITAES